MQVEIFLRSPLSACGHGDWSPPSFREHFGTCTILRSRRLVRWRFNTRIFAARGIFGIGTFRHSSTSPEMSVPKHPYCFARCQNIHVPKCSGAEISLCRNVQVPKIPCAENSPCRKFPMPKRSGVEMSICRNVRSAERCMCRNVPVMKHPCRNDCCRNDPCRNGLQGIS